MASISILHISSIAWDTSVQRWSLILSVIRAKFFIKLWKKLPILNSLCRSLTLFWGVTPKITSYLRSDALRRTVCMSWSDWLISFDASPSLVLHQPRAVASKNATLCRYVGGCTPKYKYILQMKKHKWQFPFKEKSIHHALKSTSSVLKAKWVYIWAVMHHTGA